MARNLLKDLIKLYSHNIVKLVNYIHVRRDGIKTGIKLDLAASAEFARHSYSLAGKV